MLVVFVVIGSGIAILVDELALRARGAVGASADRHARPSWGPPAEISRPSADEVAGVMRLTPPSFSASNRTVP